MKTNETSKKTESAKKTAAAKVAVSKTVKSVKTKTAVKETSLSAELPKEEICTVEYKKSVLFIASECAPFVSTGGLADVVGALPISLAKTGEIDVKVVIPLYSKIDAELRSHFSFVGNLNVPLSWRNQYLGIFRYVDNGVTYYFLDNEYYFKRDGEIYGHYDDCERFAFFSKAVLEMMGYLEYYPDIIHANDWQTALSVIYLKTLFQERYKYRNIKAVFTVHNIEYQGKFGMEVFQDLLGLPEYCKNRVEFDNCVNLMKGAIEFCDKLTTVSPTYALELKSSFFAHGLENIIAKNDYKLVGILNGIDRLAYSPETDDKLFANYSADDLSGKKVCKEQLQAMLSLPVRAEVPLVAIVTRLAKHKGIELIKCVIEEFLQKDVQVVILGKGEKTYESYFAYLESRYGGKLRAIISYNRDLASKIYSAADIFLMPSIAEPCGLAQMIALSYGAIPVVRRTGGLNDSIVSLRDNENGYGYVFNNINAHEMLYALSDAVETYKNKDLWKQIVSRGMKIDFSFDRSAKEYLKMYENM